MRKGPSPVITAPDYSQSRGALRNTPETGRVASALEALAAARPYAVPVIGGTVVRVLRAQAHGEYPALRLYYAVDEEAVRLLRIEEYEEMEEVEG